MAINIYTYNKLNRDLDVFNIPDIITHIPTLENNDYKRGFVKRYFIDDSKNRLFSMQGLSTESEISLKRIQQVIEYIRNHNISIVFFESNLPKDGLYKVIEICSRFGMDVKISQDPLYGDKYS